MPTTVKPRPDELHSAPAPSSQSGRLLMAALHRPSAPGWIAAALLFAWYSATMARGLMWFDSAELALVAQELGLGHPPGQPLYTLLLAAFARLPGLTALTGMNLLSAVAAAACALPAHSLLLRASSMAACGSDGPFFRTLPGPACRLLCLLCVGAVAPVWDQATRIEVYAPATLLSLWLLAAGARAWQEGRSDLPSWLGLGLLAGGLAAINPVFALSATAAVGLLVLPGLLRAGPWAFGRASLGALAGGSLGLSSYLYLLWVRDRGARLVWGELHSAGGLWSYLCGADYSHAGHSSWSLIPEHLWEWAAWLLAQGALPVVLLGFAGWLVASRLRRGAVLLLLPAAVGFAFSMSYSRYFPEVPDFNGYLAPAIWLGAVGLGALLQRLGPRQALAVGLLLLASTTLSGERPLWRRSRAGLQMPEELADGWLESAPRDAMLLVSSDHLVFPLMYLQQALGRRRDVVLVNTGFAASSWYWRLLYELHPGLSRIDLRASSSYERLRRLVSAEEQRPVIVESLPMAVALGLRPCPARWGFAAREASRVGECQPLSGQELGLDAWWSGPEGQDLISPRVLAALARVRGEGLWALGDASAALRALRSGVPPRVARTLTVPAGLLRSPSLPPLSDPEPVLIGSAARNLALGAAALQALGRPNAAKSWAVAWDAGVRCGFALGSLHPRGSMLPGIDGSVWPKRDKAVRSRLHLEPVRAGR